MLKKMKQIGGSGKWMGGLESRLSGNQVWGDDMTLVIPAIGGIQRRYQHTTHQQHETPYPKDVTSGVVIGPIDHLQWLIGNRTDVRQPSNAQSSTFNEGPEQRPDGAAA